MKYFNLILVVAFLITFNSCKDKDECSCSNNPTELTCDNTCRCPSDKYYQLGNFSSTCDEGNERGICFEKKVNSYLMFSDCNCTGFTAYDSVAVEMNLFLDFANKKTISSATATEGVYIEKSDGNEFEYKNIKSNFSSTPEECTGSYLGLQGYMKGKFNADNTFCETKIYWRFDEFGEDKDSCIVRFVK